MDDVILVARNHTYTLKTQQGKAAGNNNLNDKLTKISLDIVIPPRTKVTFAGSIDKIEKVNEDGPPSPPNGLNPNEAISQEALQRTKLVWKPNLTDMMLDEYFEDIPGELLDDRYSRRCELDVAQWMRREYHRMRVDLKDARNRIDNIEMKVDLLIQVLGRVQDQERDKNVEGGYSSPLYQSELRDVLSNMKAPQDLAYTAQSTNRCGQKPYDIGVSSSNIMLTQKNSFSTYEKDFEPTNQRANQQQEINT
uniref:Uncharacterized protein n=1 Tax=Romanomermis culicivorax TaxID=13658 RepID=A0A915ILP7_ROMCU